MSGEVIDLSSSTCPMERACSGWMVAPQRHNCLECRNMALLGGKVIANVIKDFKVRSSQIRMGPKTHVRCPSKKREKQDIRRGENPMKSEAKISVLQPQATEHREPTATGECKEASPLEPLEGTWFCQLLDLRLLPPER